MNEKIPTINNNELIPVPKEREILNVIEGFIGDRPYSEIIRREDEGGDLYRLILETIGDDGDPVQFDYIRAGQFPESNSSETAIDIIYLDNEGNPVGGSKAASYVEGIWVKEPG